MNSKTHALSKEIAERQSLSEDQQTSFLQCDMQALEAEVELSDECLAMIYGGLGGDSAGPLDDADV